MARRLPRFRYAPLFALAATVCGCGWRLTAPLGPHAVSVPANQGIENPLFIPFHDHELVWNQVVDEIDDYFRIEHEQRVRDVGGILMEGRIDTFPATASTYFEPWRRDSANGYEKLHGTFQSVRRRAVARVIPRPGGFFVDLNVLKELEDVNRPELATAGGNTLRHDGSLVRNETDATLGPATLGWITLGRDLSLEQQMLAELRARLTNIQPPKHLALGAK